MSEQDSSKEMALTLVRGTLTIATAGALACTLASTQLPFFVLNVDSIHSSIEQTLWYTHVRTPLGYKDVGVMDFWKCDELLSAFKGGQASTFLCLAFGGIAFFFSVFNLTSYFSRTTQRVRWVCGAPLFLFLFLALLGQLVTLAIANAMFYRNWCEGSNEAQLSAMKKSLTASVSHALADSGSSCDPFDGCVRSFEEMGFEFDAGHQAACASSILLSLCVLCELLVCAFGSTVDEEERDANDAPAVSLLTTEGQPNNGESLANRADRLV